MSSYFNITYHSNEKNSNSGFQFDTSYTASVSVMERKTCNCDCSSDCIRRQGGIIVHSSNSFDCCGDANCNHVQRVSKLAVPPLRTETLRASWIDRCGDAIHIIYIEMKKCETSSVQLLQVHYSYRPGPTTRCKLK